MKNTVIQESRKLNNGVNFPVRSEKRPVAAQLLEAWPDLNAWLKAYLQHCIKILYGRKAKKGG